MNHDNINPDKDRLIDYNEIELLDAPRLMELFSISPTTLRKWRADGVPCVHIGKRTDKGAKGVRFNPRAVHLWLMKRNARKQAEHAGGTTTAGASECPPAP